MYPNNESAQCVRNSAPYKAPLAQMIYFGEQDIIRASGNVGEDAGENDGEWT